jgi:Secretion system C-terminal sorting domain
MNLILQIIKFTQIRLLTVSNNSIIEEIEISSIMGQKIIDKKVNQLQYTIDLSDLIPGVYFAKVNSNGVEKWSKIMKN